MRLTPVDEPTGVFISLTPMMDQVSMTAQQDRISEILSIISEIAEKSTAGDFIYRGEPECYPSVSSSLYREVSHLEIAGADVEFIQEADLAEARNYTHETDDFAILTELQHFGGHTNLIDFTSDMLIALFFACDGSHAVAGRVILLKRDGEMAPHIHGPSNPVHRVLAQKSVFVRPPAGYVEPDEEIIIPAGLKFPILMFLQKHHGISTATIYNDLLGFIRSKDIHREASSYVTSAIAHGSEGTYQAAIEACGRALDVNPMMMAAYYNRGVAHRESGDLDLAIADFSHALELAPGHAVCYRQRGIAYALQGYHNMAFADFDRAIELEPENAATYYNRGVARGKQGDIDQAIADFNRAIELDSESDDYFSAGVPRTH